MRQAAARQVKRWRGLVACGGWEFVCLSYLFGVGGMTGDHEEIKGLPTTSIHPTQAPPMQPTPHVRTSRSTAMSSNVWMVRYWLMKSTPWSAKSNRSRHLPSCRRGEYQQLSPSSPVWNPLM